MGVEKNTINGVWIMLLGNEPITFLLKVDLLRYANAKNSAMHISRYLVHRLVEASQPVAYIHNDDRKNVFKKGTNPNTFFELKHFPSGEVFETKVNLS